MRASGEQGLVTCHWKDEEKSERGGAERAEVRGGRTGLKSLPVVRVYEVAKAKTHRSRWWACILLGLEWDTDKSVCVTKIHNVWRRGKF